jgi:protein TonB
MSGASMAGRARLPYQEPDRFGFALVAALLVEAAATLAFVHFANQPGPVANHRPRIMKIQMMAPPPKPLPPPPKPMPPPPKPLPPPPLPVAPPKPLPPPPPPKPIPRPVPRPIPRPIPHPMKPVPHIAVPRPQPPPPPPVQPAVSAAEVESATARYAALVHSSVQADLRVPEMVQMMHLRGVTTVSITIAPSGALVGVSVLRSSGAPPIDQAALAAVRATRFPPFSGKMPHHAVSFTLQVKLRAG